MGSGKDAHFPQGMPRHSLQMPEMLPLKANFQPAPNFLAVWGGWAFAELSQRATEETGFGNGVICKSTHWNPPLPSKLKR